MTGKATAKLQEKVKQEFPELAQEEITGGDAAVFALFRRVLKGDPKAFEVLRDTAGEKPVEKHGFVDNDGNDIFKNLSTEDLRRLARGDSGQGEG